jgi:hypothetical protein
VAAIGYSRRCDGILEHHGGNTVEMFIQATRTWAVFGIPLLHEDDALGPCSGTAEMTRAPAELTEQLEVDYGMRLQARMACERRGWAQATRAESRPGFVHRRHAGQRCLSASWSEAPPRVMLVVAKETC